MRDQANWQLGEILLNFCPDLVAACGTLRCETPLQHDSKRKRLGAMSNCLRTQRWLRL